MKKFLALILSCVLMLGACAAFAEAPAFTVASPSGAPGLALATLAVQNPENYTFVAAETIAVEFANAEADFIIAPLNAGAKLFKAGKSTYKLAGVVSWGNLVIASQREGFTLEDINGQTITLFAEGTINASVARYALEANGIAPAAIEYLGSAANTQSLLLTDADAIVVTAEPAVTAAKMKNDKVVSYSLNELLLAATGIDGYTQAALFVKAETAEAQPEAVNAFIAQVAESCEKNTTDVAAVADAAVALGLMPNVKVAVAAIPNCAIRFVSAADAREQVEATANIDIAQFGGAVPADDFYYVAQ